MKKTAFILALITFLLAITSTVMIACENSNEINIETADDSGIVDTHTAPGFDDDGIIEDELPPESFVGTVIEETTSYMIVEPNKDENEYKISDRIRVDYITDHIDYLYGKGRKVVITYIPTNYSDAVFTIKTDDIRHNGFEEFELSVQYRQDSIPARFAEIQHAGLLTYIANSREFDEHDIDYNLYYYGLHDVYVTVDGITIPLIEALRYGKVTIDGIVANCIGGVSYDDGGSVLYDFGDYRIIKYHTLDGNRDVYIGTKDMDINAKNATALCIGVSPCYDFGLRLETKDVTFEGATVIFNQFGKETDGELQTGEAFYIERLSGNKWVSIETNPLFDYAFHQVAYSINKNGITEFDTEWHWLYGALGSGKYRIAKEVTNFRGTGDYDKQVYYAYFERPQYVGYPYNDVIERFSYEEDLKEYEESGIEIKTDGFINTRKILNVTSNIAVELAMRELGYDKIDPNSITYSLEGDLYNDNVTMHKITYDETGWNILNDDGTITYVKDRDKATVYIDKYGITKLIVYGE